MREKRAQWKENIKPEQLEHLVFLDESGVNTNLTRLYGRNLSSKRVIDHTPLNTPKSTTVLSSIRFTGVDLQEQMEYIADFCSIILAKGLRSGHVKIALELCEKSYNSSRKEWYYGIKLHVVVASKLGHLPIPVSLMASGAALHDLPAAKQIIEDHASLMLGRLYADKAYIDADLAQSLKQNPALELLTPGKNQKGDTLSSGDTFSAFVNSVRQPIECFSTGSTASPASKLPLWSAPCRACSFMYSGVLPLPSLRLCSTLDSHCYFDITSNFFQTRPSKLSAFSGGNVGGAGGKCLSDGDGLLSVIDDVISFHGVVLLFYFEFCFSRGRVSLALSEISIAWGKENPVL